MWRCPRGEGHSHLWPGVSGQFLQTTPKQARCPSTLLCSSATSADVRKDTILNFGTHGGKQNESKLGPPSSKFIRRCDYCSSATVGFPAWNRSLNVSFPLLSTPRKGGNGRGRFLQKERRISSDTTDQQHCTDQLLSCMSFSSTRFTSVKNLHDSRPNPIRHLGLSIRMTRIENVTFPAATRLYSCLRTAVSGYQPRNMDASLKSIRRQCRVLEGNRSFPWGLRGVERTDSMESLSRLGSPYVFTFPRSSFFSFYVHLEQAQESRLICSFLRSVEHAKKKSIAQQKKRLPYIRTPDPLSMKKQSSRRLPISRKQGGNLHAPLSAVSSRSMLPHPFIVNDVHEEYFDKDSLLKDSQSPPSVSTLPSSTSGEAQQDAVGLVVRRVSRRGGVPSTEGHESTGEIDSREEHLIRREIDQGFERDGDEDFPTAITARTQLGHLATMRSAQHLASYLRQFFKITRTVQETGWSYVSVMHRLADDAHSMSCKDIRNACAAIASFRKARAAESHAVVPTTTHDDGLSRLWRERDSPLLGVADGEARTQDREGGRDSSPPRELEKAIWKAEEDAVEAMVKQAATQIDTADLRSACRLLALFAFFFRVFHLPFYASFSLKFSQQHLRASSQELADVAHAFGSLCLKDANLFESIAVASSSILSTFSATHLSRLLLSFALVGLSCEALFIDAAPHIVRLSSRFSPDELCHVAFAHARFRIHNPQVLAMLSERLPVAIPALRPRQLAELVISARQLKLLLSPETQASLAERLYLPALDWELLAASLMAVAPLKAVPHSFWQEAAGECLQRLLCLQIANSTETRRVESRDSSEPAVDKDAAMSRQVSSPDICSLDSELSTVVTPENCLMETDNVKDFSADYYFSRLIQPVPPTTGALVDLCACFSRLYATPSSSSNEAPADLQASLALVVSALAGTLCSPLSSLSSPSNFRQGDESYVTTPEILPIAPVKNLQPVEVARLYKALRGIRSALDIEQQSERASDDGRREGPLAVHGDPALLTLSSTEKHADRRDMCASNINRESTGLKADEHNKEVYSSAAYGDAAAVEDTLQGPAGIHSQMNLGGNARDDVSKVDEQGTKEMNIGCQVGRRTSAASRVVGDEIGASTLVQVQQSRSDEKPTGNLVKEKEARMNVTGVKPNPSSPLASHRDIKARNLLDHWVTGVIFRTVLVIQDSLQQLNEGLGDTAARLPSTTQERILEKVSQAAASLTSPEGQRRNLMTLESGLLARFSQLGPDTFTLSQLLAVVYSLVCFHPPLLPVHAARSLSQRGDDGEDDVSMETRVSRMRLQRHRLRASRSWRAPRKSLSLRTSREDDKDGITPLTDRMVSSEDREMHFMKEACQRLAETLCFIQKRDSQREDEPAPALQHLNLVQQYVVRTYIASQYPSMRLWPLRLEHRNGAAGTSTFPLHQSHGGAPSRPGLSFASAAVISEVETHLEAEGIEIHTSFVEGPFTLLAVESDRPIAYVFLCPSFYQRRPSASSDSPQVLKLKQGASSSPGIETSGFSDSSYVVAKPTETGVDTRTMALSKRRLPEAALSSSSFVLCSEVGAALRCLQLREWDLVCLPFFLWRQLPTSEERKKFLLNQRALCLALQNSRPPLSG